MNPAPATSSFDDGEGGALSLRLRSSSESASDASQLLATCRRSRPGASSTLENDVALSGHAVRALRSVGRTTPCVAGWTALSWTAGSTLQAV